MFDFKKPTVQLLGRYQPFHDGHYALAKNAIDTVGQVAIMVRDTQGIDEKNPFDFDFVKDKIVERMEKEGHGGKYIVMLVPNITNIHYGRDVGYKFEKIELSEKLQSISATEIRKEIFRERG
jgi:nicotinamide mononucleotide adenylyltransferase